jgi:peptidyl-tRNA hydrolase, PTH1 family
MKLIVGLGNPGNQYEETRHNIGFMILDKLARELTQTTVAWNKDAKHKAFIAKAGDVILVKPQTFMNASGEAVKSLVDYYKLNVSDVWVIHDDIDLPLGKIRIREKGASGGHNGVDSIIRALGSDVFVRFRMGVGRGKDVSPSHYGEEHRRRNVVSFVLSRFGQSEAGHMKHLIKDGEEAVRTALMKGLDKAMNLFN